MVETLFGGGSVTNPDQTAGAPGITTALRARVLVDGTMGAVLWRCPNTVPAGGAIWNVVRYVPATDSPGAGLGGAAFSPLTGGLWNRAACAFDLVAGDEIVIEVFNSDGNYVNSPNVFATDVVSVGGHIVGPADDAVTPRHNGRFNIGGSITFPTDGFAQNSYGVDFEFTPAVVVAAGGAWGVHV